MEDRYLYAELVAPVACAACGGSMPADRVDDMAPFVWHVVRDGRPWLVSERDPALPATLDFADSCTACGSAITYRAPVDVRLVARDVSPSSGTTPPLPARSEP